MLLWIFNAWFFHEGISCLPPTNALFSLPWIKTNGQRRRNAGGSEVWKNILAPNKHSKSVRPYTRFVYLSLERVEFGSSAMEVSESNIHFNSNIACRQNLFLNVSEREFKIWEAFDQCLRCNVARKVYSSFSCIFTR